MIKLFNNEALQTMEKLIKEGVKVDAVICDPPYGTTACEWDKIIDFEKMWEKLLKLIKPNGAIVLFGSQPYTAKLINSNFKLFRYEYIWEKTRATNFLNAKKMPMKKHENILVFYKKMCTYNPQGLIKVDWHINSKRKSTGVYGNIKDNEYIQKYTNYPHSILKYPSISNGEHPTQKPLELMEFLVKTYTNEGETVLDFTMGSGSTGVAAVKNKRSFIGIELDKKYYEISERRISEVANNERIFDE